jgi:hypothetical protein
MAAAVKRALAGAALPIAVASAAQPLADPTLPPNVSVASAPAVAPAPPLQFTLRGPGETYSALLAGRWVRPGDSFELNGTTFRVERVTATSVVLARGDQREVLEMSPQAAKAVRCRNSENNNRSCR